LSKKGGILLYLRQEGRGIGLYEKVKAYRLQDSGFDTFEANLMLNHPEDARDFKVAAEMLKALGISQVTLISNNPDKRKSLEQNNIHVTLQIPTKTYCTPHNQQYLEAKKERMGHLLFFDYKQAVSLVNWGVK
jgi:GTP cyclohydrolase II